MRQYKSLESQTLPAGAVPSIDAFKTKVLDEFYMMADQKNKVMKETGRDADEIPLPIAVYVLYEDMSIRRTMMFPENPMEKKAMLIALKKQIKTETYGDKRMSSTKAVYGVITSEVWMCNFRMPEGLTTEAEKKAAVEEFNRQFKAGEAERETKLIVQFENPVTREYDIRVFGVIDPFILVEDPAHAEEMTNAMNAVTTDAKITKGLMESIFNYTEEEEMDVLGSVRMEVSHFSLKDAIEFVRKALLNPSSEVG